MATTPNPTYNTAGKGTLLIKPEQLWGELRAWDQDHQADVDVTVAAMLEQGMNVDAHDAVSGCSVMHYAAKSGARWFGDDEKAATLVSHLILKGADPNRPCKFLQMTPLHYAAYFGCELVIGVLAKSRSRTGHVSAPVVQPGCGPTWMRCESSGHPMVVPHGSCCVHCSILLLSARPSPLTISLQPWCGLQVDLHRKTPAHDGATALHLAVANVNHLSVKALLAANHNCLLRNDLGKTPLDVALDLKGSKCVDGEELALIIEALERFAESTAQYESNDVEVQAPTLPEPARGELPLPLASPLLLLGFATVMDLLLPRTSSRHDIACLTVPRVVTSH